MPPLDEVFSEVKRKRVRVMLGEENDSIYTFVEGSTLALKGGENGYHREQGTGRRVRCDRCNRLSQTKDKCWLLHEKPGIVSKREEPATTQISLSKEQMDQLCRLLNQS